MGLNPTARVGLIQEGAFDTGAESFDRRGPVTPETNSKSVRDGLHPRNKKNSMRTAPRPKFSPSQAMHRILPQDIFLKMLCLERKRAERSGKKFFLLLMDALDAVGTDCASTVLRGIVKAADTVRRETDPAGWYEEGATLGIIFTDPQELVAAAAIDMLIDKIRCTLARELNADDSRLVHVSLHVFGDESDEGRGSNIPANPAFYPDLFHQQRAKKVPLLVKRAMDILVSITAIALHYPVFCLVALEVKLTSKGPVLFKQERLGLFGKSFTFLKFRSMSVNNDPRIHQEFMKQLINGTCDRASDSGSGRVYKMTDDPRITRVGRFLRRTSLDELPQFFNVLKGDMSLVGPRPPLAYEYEEYDMWHRRRVLEIKPGITGLWQVHGRSRVRFDDMVRLDLQYARSWSLWLDIQILLKTPAAVMFGGGAY